MIPRPLYSEAVSRALLRSPVTALLGSRQCGKTTLARLIGQKREAHYYDMESPVDRQRLQNPELALGTLSGLVIIDGKTRDTSYISRHGADDMESALGDQNN